MRRPDQNEWLRAETLANQLAVLSPAAIETEFNRLVAKGESELVLKLTRELLIDQPPRPVFQTGTVVNGYQLISILGEGSMGTVWRARQEFIEREVAIKVVHSQLLSTDRRDRFLREMQTLGQLSHPGIVQVYGAGLFELPSGGSVPFFAMELVEGLPLNHWAATQAGQIPALLRVMAAVCDAVQNAHDRRVIHRDLKPANIVVRGNGRPVVLDFGIARLIGSESPTSVNTFEGTPVYAAPEQYLGRDMEMHDGATVDLYAVGVILFELLSGRLPFEIPAGSSFATIRQAKLEGRVLRLSEAWPECPPLVDEIVSRTVRREPADRVYANLAEMGRALDTAADRLSPERAAKPPWKPSPGAVIPRTNWELDRKIGEGGAGEVWLGHHRELQEERVFKFCDSEEKARTLRRELTVYRLLRDRVGRNPHFVPLHEVSLAEPPWYLMMEHVASADLAAWCAALPGGLSTLPIETRIEIVAQAAEALQAAHEAGILHRDIKPANLLIQGNPAGGTEAVHVLVADFGIGQIVADDVLRSGDRPGFTRPVSELARTTISGTLFYLAPEVLGGQPATARSDIYSLGVVLWQLLTENLSMGLAVTDWSSRISDPHLRHDLSRCLSGEPGNRWPSAGEFAAQLRQLPERRAAESRRLAELDARERAAYWRGVARVIGFATMIIALIAGLAWQVWRKEKASQYLLGENYLIQLSTLDRTDLEAGRRQRGLVTWQLAAELSTNRVGLRSTAALVLGLPDLEMVPAPPASTSLAPQRMPMPLPPPLADETTRTLSHNGRWLAMGRDRNGIDGIVDLLDVQTRARQTLTWTHFPWLPVPEPGLLQFSPNDEFLAVGGTRSSRHLLLIRIPDGATESYIFHSADLLACAWHPGTNEPIIATSCADHSILVWDMNDAVRAPNQRSGETNFELPPRLDIPAMDRPRLVLLGHDEPVLHLAFSSTGRWLASVDQGGLLKIHQGFHKNGLSGLADGSGIVHDTEAHLPQVTLAVQHHLGDPLTITALSFEGTQVVVHRGKSQMEAYRFHPGMFPAEQAIGSGITHWAWSRDEKRLCVLTHDDAVWLDSETLEVIARNRNIHADGICAGTDPDQLLVSFLEFEGPSLTATANLGRLSPSASTVEGPKTVPFQETIPNNAIAPLVATDDGRMAIRIDHQLTFFTNALPAGRQILLEDPTRSMEVVDWFWDAPGKRFGVVWAGTNSISLNLWGTDQGFPSTNTALASIPLGPHSRVAAANDGKSVLIRSTDKGLSIIEPGRTGFVRSNLLDDTDFARQSRPMAASRDGRLVAMVGGSGNIRLLELPSGRLFAEFYGSNHSPIQSMQWHPKGHQLATVTENGVIQVWSLDDWFRLLQQNPVPGDGLSLAPANGP